MHAPADTGPFDADALLHFSEDPSIERFEPHHATGRGHEPARVWAIDAAHAPLYWFPRDCPRVTTWARTPLEEERLRARCSAAAPRLHAIEAGWLERMQSVRLFVYRLDPAGFERWPAADGHWTSRAPALPLGVQPVGDLLGLHEQSGIELRTLDDLWPMHDLVASGDLPFSIVRMRNAAPRR